MVDNRFEAGSYFPEDNDTVYDEEAELRLQHQIDVQSLQIERILSENQVPADIQGESVSPEHISFNLRTHVNSGLQRICLLKNELIASLGVSDVKLQRENGTVKLVVKRSVPHPVDLLDLLQQEYTSEDEDSWLIEAALGLDEEGRSVVLDLASADINNILVAGKDGSGKSCLIRTMAVSLAIKNRQSEVQVGIITSGLNSSRLVTKPDALYPMNYLPHLLFPVVNNVEDAIEALEFLADEIKYRHEASLKSPLLVVFIDDVDWHLIQGGTAFSEPLIRLLDAPDDTGLRMIISAKDPIGSGLAPLLKHNLPLRLVGRVEDEHQAYALTAQPESGADYLNGHGDFLAVSYNSILRFQSAFINDYDLHLTLTGLHRTSKGTLLAKSLKKEIARARADNSDDARAFKYDGVNGQTTFSQQANEENAQTIDEIDSFDDETTDDNNWLPVVVEENESVTTIGEEDDFSGGSRVDIDDSIPVVAAGPRYVSPSKASGTQNGSFEESEDIPRSRPVQSELEYSDLEEEEWLPESEKNQSTRQVNRLH